MPKASAFATSSSIIGLVIFGTISSLLSKIGGLIIAIFRLFDCWKIQFPDFFGKLEILQHTRILVHPLHSITYDPANIS